MFKADYLRALGFTYWQKKKPSSAPIVSLSIHSQLLGHVLVLADEQDRTSDSDALLTKMLDSIKLRSTDYSVLYVESEHSSQPVQIQSQTVLSPETLLVVLPALVKQQNTQAILCFGKQATQAVGIQIGFSTNPFYATFLTQNIPIFTTYSPQILIQIPDYKKESWKILKQCANYLATH